MNPTIQLIHLTVRFEREEQVQRDTFVTPRNDFANEKSASQRKLDYRGKQIVAPSYYQQSCGTA